MTIDRKATQLASFDRFVKSHNLSYPATGNDLACYIGYIAESRMRGEGTAISGASLSGYLSVVRTSLVALGHPRLPTCPESFPLREIHKAYIAWDAVTFGANDVVRIAIPASVIYKMIDLAMRSVDDRVLRDVAMIVMARVHGLRASSVEALLRSDLDLEENGLTVLVTRLKGHTLEQAKRYGARRFISPSVSGFTFGCLDVLLKWDAVRPPWESLLFG